MGSFKVRGKNNTLASVYTLRERDNNHTLCVCVYACACARVRVGVCECVCDCVGLLVCSKQDSHLNPVE